MMTTTAGGPGLVSPFDYNERRTPRFSRTTWIAVAIVTAAHVGLGAALYYQRFELALPPEVDQRPPTIVEIVNLPKPKPVPAPDRPQPPNTRTNDLPTAPATPDVIAVAKGETVADSPSISVLQPSPDPVPEAAATPTPPQPPAVITNPSWVRQPSEAQLMRAYPDRALQADVGGRATLNCLVQPNGRVADCNLMAETPGGYGFGRAAQDLTRHFQLNPRTVDGAAVGSRVNIGIRFTPPSVN